MSLINLTLKQAHDKLASGEVTSLELTQACINRVKESDDKLHALLATDFDSALKQAKEADEYISKNKKLPSSVFGIPCTIKDLLMTQGIKSTAGSKMLENYLPEFDATVVKKLKDAGAIIIGKNNLDAWAHGGSTENSDFGPSKNPWDISRVPGGSSGGSASSVASDQSFFSIGTDTGGSIRQPAGFCGIVGLKPTYGRVSRYGAAAMGSSLDTIGPMTKSVEDAALIMNIIAGKDSLDGTTLEVEVPDYTKFLGQDIKGLKIGVPKQIKSLLPEKTLKIFEESLDRLKSLGAVINEVDMKYLEYGIATYYIIMPSEVSSNLGRYDGVRYGHRSKDAKNINETYLKSRQEGFGDEAKRRIMIGTYVLSAGYYDAYYKKAMKVRTLIKDEFEKVCAQNDVIVMPTTLGVAFPLGDKTSDPLAMYLEDIFTVTANIAGVPALSVPAGLIDGLPFGIQFIAGQFQEGKLFRVGDAFEKETKFTKKLAV